MGVDQAELQAAKPVIEKIKISVDKKEHILPNWTGIALKNAINNRIFLMGKNRTYPYRKVYGSIEKNVTI